MENNSGQDLNQRPPLCRTDCGFCGSKFSNDGFCSKCSDNGDLKGNGVVTPACPNKRGLSIGNASISSKNSNDSKSPDATEMTEEKTKIIEYFSSRRSPSPYTKYDPKINSKMNKVEHNLMPESLSLSPDFGLDDRVTAQTSTVSNTEAISINSNFEKTCLDSSKSISKTKTKIKKNRCFECQKRVGLIGYDCRCGQIFCNVHRYSDKHYCTFNYKTHGRDMIRKCNPLVEAEKITKL